MFSGSQIIAILRARQIRGQVDDLEAEIVKGKSKEAEMKNGIFKMGKLSRSFKTDVYRCIQNRGNSLVYGIVGKV